MSVTSPERSPEEERLVTRGIAMADEAQTKEGDTFCLINQRWWRTWSAFVYQNPTISTNEGASIEHQGSRSSTTLPRPSSIDNSDLIYVSSSENPTFEIYDTLVEGTDYILVTENIWNQFHEWYGGGPTLARKVITRGSSQTELTVEIYPLRLVLHFMPRADQFAIRMSRKETIGALHRKACEIFVLNSDQVNIWDYYGRRKHALLDELDKTLDDANIQTDQDILVEVIDHSGRYITAVQVNGSSRNHLLQVLEPSRMNHSIPRGSSANNGFLRRYNSDLSQFQNLSFATERGPASFGVSTRGPCFGLIGLINSGNTCFINSAIQCLVHIPEFARYFIGDFYHEINWQNLLGMEGELAMAFGELLRKLWSPGRASFSPRAFKATLARFAPQFGGKNQHDSQEFLAFLLDGLHEDLNRAKQKPFIESRDADGLTDEQVADMYWANHVSRNDSIIVDVCQGQYKSTLICPMCDKISVTFDPFMYLSLPLQSGTPRAMTVTVFSCDGSALPVTVTLTVPKQGCCRDLIQELSKRCSLTQNEKILLAEIRDHLIHRFFEDPLMSLSVIKDDERIIGYKIPKLMKDTRYIQLVHRREHTEASSVGGTTMWKPYGTPVVFAVSNDANITKRDLQLIAHTLLSPILKPESSKTTKSSIACDPLSTASDENGDSVIKLPLKLVDGNNNPIDILDGEEKTINLLLSSISVVLYIDWSEELVKKYETRYLENFPEVSKNGHGMKKSCVERLCMYTCIEAFLREEPLVPDDMWFCPQCKEQRQASKKLDLWKLPEVLVIHLKRFSYSRTMNCKINTLVDFPLRDFDLTKYVANKNKTSPQIYELYAVANHYGTMARGHYNAHVKV